MPCRSSRVARTATRHLCIRPGPRSSTPRQERRRREKKKRRHAIASWELWERIKADPKKLAEVRKKDSKRKREKRQHDAHLKNGRQGGTPGIDAPITEHAALPSMHALSGEQTIKTNITSMDMERIDLTLTLTLRLQGQRD